MKKYFSYILTLIVWAAAFYIYLPAINIKSPEFWGFIIFLAASGLVINAYKLIKQIDPRNLKQSIANGTKGT